SPLPDLAMLGRGDCEGSIILLSEKTGWVFASTACHRAKVLEGDDGSFRQGRHGFNDDGRNTDCLYVERVGSTWRQVDYASAREWAAIIDFDDYRTAVVEVGHLRKRGQRERAMRRGGGDRVEDFAARGLSAHEVIPGGFAELTLGRSHSSATGAARAIAA